MDKIWYCYKTEDRLDIMFWQDLLTDGDQIWVEQAKIGMGGRSLFWLDTRLLQDVGDNTEQVWKRGWGAGYLYILMVLSHITRYLITFYIFWKIDGLGECSGCPEHSPRCSCSCWAVILHSSSQFCAMRVFPCNSSTLLHNSTKFYTISDNSAYRNSDWKHYDWTK